MRYLTAHDYGVIGNQFSSALINHLGSVDWCCFPYLDSPSHFGAFIDKTQGGHFQIMPQGEFRSKHHYVMGTNVLETHFETPMGRATLTDWMPVDVKSGLNPVLCRKIEVIEGTVSWILTCTPRFRYGTEPAQAEKHPSGILFRGNQLDDLATLHSEVPLEISANGSSAVARFKLETGKTKGFTWAWGRRGAFTETLSTEIKLLSHQNLQEVIEYWQNFAHKCPSSGCVWGGPWHDNVTRSSLVLKLLIQSYSGSIAQGVSVSVKGLSSSTRTWGHRYASIREGAFTIQALANLGHSEEARSHFAWIKEIIERDGAEGLQSIYTLDGGKILPEGDLPYLNNHEASRLFQLDIYGHVMVAATEYFRIFGELPNELWPKLCEVADYVCQAWKRPDHGPWGFTHKPEHFVVSKLFCWAALDQICWLARAIGTHPSPRWIGEKTILHKTICDQGFDPVRNSFVRAFGDREIDSSILWIPVLNFLPTDDPRVQGTLDAVRAELSQGVLLKQSRNLYGIQREEIIDFWSSFMFISCLALSGQVEEASDRLAEICSYASPLGLFGDQIDPIHDGIPKFFPSASVHLSLINAALYVGWARGRQKPLTHLIGSLGAQPAKSA